MPNEQAQSEASNTPDNSEDGFSGVDHLGIKKHKKKSKHLRYAKELDKAQRVYWYYAVLDGLSNACSLFKYGFDLFYLVEENSLKHSSDGMLNWMDSSDGALVAASATIAIIGFSLLAHLFKENDANKLKRYIATMWPYCRDVIKGLKNGYKGVKSMLQLAENLGKMAKFDLNYLILPIGLAIGILGAINRIIYRYYKKQRKAMNDINKKTLEAIRKNEYNRSEIEAEQKRQEAFLKSSRWKTSTSQFVSGIVDGMYLFLGVAMLQALNPTLFIALAALSLFFIVVCIATRIYEDFSYRRDIEIANLKIDLALQARHIEAIFDKLEVAIKNHIDVTECQTELGEETKKFIEKHKKMRSMQKNENILFTILSGLKNGLAAYSFVMSGFFTLAAINTVFAFGFICPPVIIAVVAIGLGLLIAGCAWSLYQRNALKQQEETYELDKYKGCFDAVIKNVPEHKQSGVRDCDEKVTLDPSPQYFAQEWFEVIRSFFSGFSKAFKAVEMILGPSFDEPDEEGHFVPTTVMGVVMLCVALPFALVLAIRAFAKYLSPKLAREQEDFIWKEKAVIENESIQTASLEKENEVTEEESIQSASLLKENKVTEDKRAQPAVRDSSITANRAAFYNTYNTREPKRPYSAPPSCGTETEIKPDETGNEIKRPPSARVLQHTGSAFTFPPVLTPLSASPP